MILQLLREYSKVFVFIFFVICTIYVFREYFFAHKVPVPGNLLVSFYSPWRHEAWAGYPNGVANKPIGSDILKLFYPYRAFTTRMLAAGEWPLWNPYVFAGNVHAATYQSAVFYPLNFIYFLLPQMDAWSLLVIIQPILAGLFTYLFITSLGLSKKASLFGAIAFAFSGWMTAWWEESLVIEHSILWLPLSLYAVTKLYGDQKRSYVWWTLVVISLTCSVLAGFLQMTIYLFVITGPWSLYLAMSDVRKNGKTLISIGFATGVSLLIASVQLLPALEAYLSSPRGTVKATFLFDTFLMPLTHLVTFVAPDFWGNPGAYNYFFPKVFYHEKVISMGIVPFLFVLYAYVKANSGSARFWKVVGLVSLSLGFQLPTSWIWHVLKIPILSVAQPSRVFAVSVFALSVLCAFGLERYLVRPRRWEMKMPLVVVTSILGGLWLFVLVNAFVYLKQSALCAANPVSVVFARVCGFDRDTLGLIKLFGTVSLRNLILPTVFVAGAWSAFVFLAHKKTLLYVSVVALSLLSSFYFAQKFLYFSERQFVFPDIAPTTKLKELAGVDRVWGYGNAYSEKNTLSYYSVYSPEGYDALYPQRYGELLFTIKNQGKLTDQIPRTDADLKPASEDEPMSSNPYRLRLMSLLGVRYILELKKKEPTVQLAESERFPKDLFVPVWENDTWRIWKYQGALPRTFFAGSYIVETDKQKAVDYLLRDDFDAKKTLILEAQPNLPLSVGAEAATSEVHIIRYTPNEVELSVNATGSGFVFLSDNYAPGWKALVDGKEAKIYRADYTFRAVHVASGDHKVVFSYQPASFSYGRFLSGSGLILLCIGIFILYKKNRKS